MKLSAKAMAAAAASATLLCASSPGRETVLVIGDSLSREYQFEFPAFPEARNWVELLAVHRPDDFYFGPLESSDLGLLADACELFSLNNALCDAIGDDGQLDRYRYNWAIPTYTAESYAGDLTGGSIFQRLLKDLIDNDFDNVDAVVVFLGGNDIDSVYSSVYNGNTSATNNILARIENDLEDIIDFVLDDTPGMHMILVNVPHVGATPEVKADHPTHPVKTGRVTAALQTLDTNLRTLAAAKNIGYADILSLTVDLLPDDPYCIGGIPFINRGTDSGDPEFLWLGGNLSQNFHPNTNGQALLANAIIAGFNEKYGIGAQPFGETEIVEDLLGLQSQLTAWAASFGLPANQRQPDDDPEMDGLTNLVEFALDLDPSRPSQLPTPTCDAGTLRFEYRLRPQACDQVSVTPEFCSDLIHWRPVPAENLATLPDGRYRVSLAKTSAPIFVRLRIVGS